MKIDFREIQVKDIEGITVPSILQNVRQCDLSENRRFG